MDDQQPSGIDRSQFNDEMSDPGVRNSLAAITHREVGGQGPDAQQAFIESVFNRAASRGTSVSQTISGQDGYYPRQSLQGVGGIPQSNLGALDGIINTVHTQGTNLSNGATGNASGNVGFAGGPQTFSAGGERFGREGRDAKWTPPYIGSPPQQASASMPAPMGLGGPPQQQGRPMPAPGQQDDGQQGGFGGLLSQLNDPVKSPLYSPLTQIGLGLLSHPTQPAGVGLAAGVKSGQDANEFRYKMQQRQQDQALSSSLQGANAPAWFKALPPEVQGVFSQLPPDQLASSIAGYVSKRSDLDQAAKLQTQQLGITNKFALEQQRAQFQQIMDMAKGAQQAGQQQVNQSPNPQPPQRLKWIPQ